MTDPLETCFEGHNESAGLQISILQSEIINLRHALQDCMSYVDADNLTMQTKRKNWNAVLNGTDWKSSNVDVETAQ